MFVLNDDLSIYVTRGDIVFFAVTAEDGGKPYTFKAGDVVRIKIFGKKDAESVVLEKSFPVTDETESVEIFLSGEDTTIGKVISKPMDYWYEVELNPLSNPQTLIGYDEDGAKIFRLFPEGKNLTEYIPDADDLPFIDDNFDVTSQRPIANQVVARAVIQLRAGVDATKKAVDANAVTTNGALRNLQNEINTQRARIDNQLAGKTTDAGELLDLRVGANGKTYATAGSAIRGQFAEIKNDLNTNFAHLQSRNLVNKEKFTYGYYVDYSTGNFVAHAESAYTEFIRIKPATRYTFSMHATNRALGQLAFYDNEGKYISGIANSGVKNYKTFTSPSTAHFVVWTIPVGYVDMVSIIEGEELIDYEDYYSFIPREYTEKVVEVGAGCKYTSLLKALKQTSSDTTIYVHTGVYNVVDEYKEIYGDAFFDNYEGYANKTDKFYRGLWLGNGRKVIGVGNVELIFDYDGGNSNVHELFSVIANDSNVLLDNVAIKVNSNCRYHIHDDFQPENGNITFRNLILDGKPKTPVFIGGGIGKNVTYHIDSCLFLNDEGAVYDISYHGNTTDDTGVACNIKVTNCYGAAACAFRWYGNSTKVTLCKVSGSKFSHIECVAYDEAQFNENMKLVAWNNG